MYSREEAAVYVECTVPTVNLWKVLIAIFQPDEDLKNFGSVKI